MPYLLALAVAVLLAVLIAETSRASLARATVSARLHKSESVLRFFTNHQWMIARRHQKCRGVPWQRTCTIARGLVRQHTVARRQQRRWLYRHLPVSNDWVTSVRIVQRVYPGTEGWLLSCSSAEGGHGRWVWYGGRSWQGYHIGGDTVGGQMQFRYSTFAPYWNHAQKNVIHRGFQPPDLGSGYSPWLSPMGQAITGAYMRYHGKDGHHWSASHGRGC